MTSVGRYTASNLNLPNPMGAVMLTYNITPESENATYLPVPITYDKTTGKIDFDFSTGFSSSTTIDSNETVYLRSNNLSAIHNVTGIGPNMIAWLENEGGADAGSVTVYEKPVVVRVNATAVPRDPNGDGAMEESTDEISFEKSSGSSANNFYATYLFKKPLVVKYTKPVEDVTTVHYRMFTTQLSPQT